MKISTLREESGIEIQHMQQSVKDITELLDLVSNRVVTVYERAAAGMLLAQFYTGTENILKPISKYQVYRCLKVRVRMQSCSSIFVHLRRTICPACFQHR